MPVPKEGAGAAILEFVQQNARRCGIISVFEGGATMDAVTQDGQRGKRSCGKLTIFASYLSGAGKSYAMLRAGEQARAGGMDVVIGLFSEHLWPETRRLAEGFERVPCVPVEKQGAVRYEVDLRACLNRKPQVLLIDDLSYQNIGNARYKKRYQEIWAMLEAGIDVYTTLDIQNMESIQDTVSAIVGGTVSERIPDGVFDRAAQVYFVDIEPECLRERLRRAGKTELLARYSAAEMSALREVGLRRCADRAALYTKGIQNTPDDHSREHILVCLSPSPANAKVIRTAAGMAGAFRCNFTALFVETRSAARMTAADRERLDAHVRLAEQLGASAETLYGEDAADQIAEFARISGVTRVVLGRSRGAHGRFLWKTSLTERLIGLVPELDVHIIPDSGTSRAFSDRRREGMHIPMPSLRDLEKSVLIFALTTLISVGFYRLGFTEANIITLYILGVMLISVFTKSPVCSLAASIVSVLAFNFFFTAPRFSLQTYDSGYPVTFLVMFLASLLTGSLAARLKFHAKRSAQVAWRTRLLFETNQNLQKAHSQSEILSITARQMVKIFQRDIVACLAEGGALQPLEIFSVEEAPDYELYTSEREREAAQWVLKNNRRAGAGTDALSDARCTYLSIRTGEQVYGVVGIAVGDRPLDSFECSLLLSVLGECALALENRKNLEEKEAAAVLAKNEQLRANLLRSISHDLRTPLTSISGNASNLLSNGGLFDEKAKEQMYTDIYDDAMWLINLVENLLSVSRLEEGRMNLHLSTELMDEVVAEALRHINRKSVEYRLQVQSSDEYTLVRIDAKLIVQVLINIVDNAIKYTPPRSEINIGWRKRDRFVEVSIADNGPGISDEAKPHIFDMFYSAANQIADSRRSIGLGLALCKSIVNAHGGGITVSDHVPQGTIFTFSVPAGEVELHE